MDSRPAAWRYVARQRQDRGIRSRVDSLQQAFRRGAFVAVRDFGVQKNLFPGVRSIVVSTNYIEIDVDAQVTWISGGTPVGPGPRIELVSLTQGYLRPR